MSFLVIDCGTSACRASCISEKGVLTAQVKQPVQVYTTLDHKAEINPDELWQSVTTAVKELVRLSPDQKIDAIGVSSLLGYVFLDRENQPLTPAIIWMDNRAVVEAEELLTHFGAAALYEKTGRRLSSELLAPKLLWLQRHEPELYRKIAKIIGLKDELVKRITGVLQTDYAHLDYSALFNIARKQLDQELLAFFDLQPAIFPEPVASMQIVGHLSSSMAQEWGLPAGIPVISGTSDGTTAMYGGGVTEDGAAVLVSGTTDVLMYKTSAFFIDPHQALSINTGMLDNMYLAGGAMGLSGGAIHYFNQLLNAPFQTVLDDIQAIPPGSEGLLLLPGLSGERAPYWNPRLSGGLLGLGLQHRAQHIYRAIMEGTAFRIRRVLDIMRANGLVPEKLVISGGCAEFDCWNQIRADVLGMEIMLADVREATSLGAAMFCRTALDPAITLAEVAQEWIGYRSVYHPDPDHVEQYHHIYAQFNEYLRLAGKMI